MKINIDDKTIEVLKKMLKKKNKDAARLTVAGFG